MNDAIVSHIVSSDAPLTLLGGCTPPESDLRDAMRHAPSLVCADGGANTALAFGLAPVAVIGDMDSISDPARAAFDPVLHPVAEQDSTDFDKVLRNVRAPLCLAVGFSGGRLDHELGALTVLAGRPDRRCIVIGAETITLLCPPQIRFDPPKGMPVSLFPLAPVTCDSTGLHWPTKGIRFAPDGRIGTLNRADGPVTLTPDRPKMLLMLPREALDLTVEAVLRSGAQWPVRAE